MDKKISTIMTGTNLDNTGYLFIVPISSDMQVHAPTLIWFWGPKKMRPLPNETLHIIDFGVK